MSSCELCRNKPVYWCFDCDGGLCTACENYHRKIQACSVHKTVLFRNYSELPEFISNIKHFCRKHNEKFQMFCNFHNRPCCLKCVTDNHNRCPMVSLNDVIKKTSLNTQYISYLQETSTIISNTIADMDSNIKSLEEDKNTIAELAERAKQEEIERINRKYRILTAELTNAMLGSRGDIKQRRNKLGKEEKDIQNYVSDLHKINRDASELQIFLGMNQIRERTLEYYRRLEELEKDGTLDKIHLSCSIRDHIKTCTNEKQKYVHITIEKTKSEVFGDLHKKIQEECMEPAMNRQEETHHPEIPEDTSMDKRKKYYQAQMIKPNDVTRLIDSISYEFDCVCKVPGSDIRGCCRLSNNSMVFVSEKENALFVINSNESQNYKITCPSKLDLPCGLTTLSRNTVAVALNDSIHFVNINDKSIRRKITDLGGHVNGITYRDGNIFCCVSPRGIMKISLMNDVKKMLVSRPLSHYSYIATNGDNIYYTDYTANSVFCCDIEGRGKWKFSDENVLKYPRDVTVDADGFIYVIGDKSNNVIAISPDGTHHREILSAKNNLNEPWVLHYNMEAKDLLVVNSDGHALIFNEKQKRHRAINHARNLRKHGDVTK